MERMPNKSILLMKSPQYIEFHQDTKNDLCRLLKAAEPEEGCAIVIGKKKNSTTESNKYFWEIKHIWKSKNIWGQQESKSPTNHTSKIPNQKNINFSRANRFEINAKDQIAAQKWSRKNDLEILCFAHSHPSDANVPSKIDLLLHQSPGLMIISNKNGNLKAWWIKNKFDFHRVKIKVFSLT